ncbi:protein-arginine deiminase type-4-like [Petaurus breviceps papuanus]|uniref:protein-arginine deiminase type-4-like n=1 Tax=Petaurus breviceps papuanus TaxID=3040969 RepID=UPI0036DF793D
MDPPQSPSREPERPTEQPMKTLVMSLEQPNTAVCPVGITLLVDVVSFAPEGYKTFEALTSESLLYNVEGTKFNFAFSGHPSRWYLQPSCSVTLKALVPSSMMFSDWIKITYFKSGEEHSNCVATMNITCVSSVYSPWQGPIMLVNCGCRNQYPPNPHEDMFDNRGNSVHLPKMVLKIQSPLGFFNTHQLVINCSHPDRVRLFGFERPCINPPYRMVLGPNRPFHVVTHLKNQENRLFYVEALSFPDADFSGLVSFTVSLLENSNNDNSESTIHRIEVIFRVAPWIMIANTQPPVEIYVTRYIRECNFMETIIRYSCAAQCHLAFCPPGETRLDTWIGNEVAIGYTYTPEQLFHVFLDFPWKKELRRFVFKNCLMPNFGYVIREREDDDHLDAPGFLEVSPPVTANGIFYPLGRILIGDGGFPREKIPEVNIKLRSFLYAQNVQDPLELFSAWLLEGNVKEFLTFVPANDRKGFRLLLASPSTCYELFKLQQTQGHGNASVLDSVDQTMLCYTGISLPLIPFLLSVQTCIAYNQRVLEAELGISERDIIYIPQLFRLGWIQDPITQKEVLRAGHLFPNMLNMIVLGSHLGIPKPYGPLVHGVCCVEKKVQSLLEPLGLNCHFIGEFFGHQGDQGDAYYWINVRRKPFSYKWWNIII